MYSAGCYQLSKFLKYNLILFFIVATKCESNNLIPQVLVNNEYFQGSILGVEQLNFHNEKYSAFLGIPYAKQPLGELRFKDPQKPEKFVGDLDATHHGFDCCSITARNASEDCLNLNVYTKNLNPIKPLPVLFIIHPGGFYLGTGNQYYINSTYLLTKDIVMVSFNYRLGTLGFLNLGTEKYPGNAGLKDQALALQWVKDNIAHFGGDANDITLMGYSAGATSVALHLLSPMSKNKFQKAIIMGGAVPPQTLLPQGQQKYLAIRQAEVMNCSSKQVLEQLPLEQLELELINCFSKFSGQEIAKTLRQLFVFGKDNPLYLWLPVVEEDFGQQRFLTDDFYGGLKALTQLKMPILTGYTNGELCIAARELLTDDGLRQRFEKEYEILAPICFVYDAAKDKSSKTQAIFQHYLNGAVSELSNNDHDAICDIYSDSFISFGTHYLAEMVSQQLGGLVYLYEFQYQSSKQPNEQFPNKKDRVDHMDDFQYIINWKGVDYMPGSDDFNMVELFTEFIYDFIQNGKLSQADAKPYPKNYAIIQREIQFVEGKNFANYKFWFDLFKDEQQN